MFWGNTLFFKGCMLSHVCKELLEAYRRVLELLKIDFIEMPQEPCCGRPLVSAGCAEVFEKQKERIEEKFRELSVKRVLCACPACWVTLKELFPKMRIELIQELLMNAVLRGKVEVFGERNVAFYQEPCHLRGKVDLRPLLKALKVELKESEFSAGFSMCCGAGGGVRTSFKELAIAVGKERVKDAIKAGAQVIVTSCPLCYMHLKECAGDKIKVLEVSQLVEG